MPKTDKWMKQLGQTKDPEKRRSLLKKLKGKVIFEFSCNTSCIWRLGHEWNNCSAFPDGVPEDISNGVVIHDHSIPGDGGLVYSPMWEPLTDEQRELFRKSLSRGLEDLVSEPED